MTRDTLRHWMPLFRVDFLMRLQIHLLVEALVTYVARKALHLLVNLFDMAFHDRRPQGAKGAAVVEASDLSSLVYHSRVFAQAIARCGLEGAAIG